MTVTLLPTSDARKWYFDSLKANRPYNRRRTGEGTVDNNPPSWKILGRLECVLQWREVIEVDLFFIDGKELAFRTDPEHYYRGVDASKLMAIIQATDPN